MSKRSVSRCLVLKIMIFLILGITLLTVYQTKEVKAARMSYNKAVTLYNNVVISKWARYGKKFKVTDDLRDNGCWNVYKYVGKKVTLKPLYYSDYVRYIFTDLDGDKTVEALLYIPGYVSVFTIKNGKIKTLAVIRTPDDLYAPDMFYNKRKKTFSLRTLVTARSVGVKAYRFKKGKLVRVTTLGDYIGSMESNGKSPYTCWINKKRASSGRFKKYMKTYVSSYKKAIWGP